MFKKFVAVLFVVMMVMMTVASADVIFMDDDLTDYQMALNDVHERLFEVLDGFDDFDVYVLTGYYDAQSWAEFGGGSTMYEEFVDYTMDSFNSQMNADEGDYARYYGCERDGSNYAIIFELYDGESEEGVYLIFVLNMME